ncbi:hypothetical protein G6F68_019931 [Rhizopus microsporus]|nr:hypothetical protein G6F68_019931 [Rhizopus microsporus]
MASGEFSGSDTKSRHSLNALVSQRSATKASSINPSVAITCASDDSSAVLVPGRTCRWKSALMCGELTSSMRRGSITIRRAPWRSRRFRRDANTGWPLLGLAPITMTTSVCMTESKVCVPADSPSVCFRP